MEELLREVAQIREKCGQYRNEIGRLLCIPVEVEDPRRGCFIMVFNRLIFTLEVLRCYQSLWAKPRNISSTEEMDRLRRENTERCIMALKWLFVGSLSCIEYSAKASIACYPESPLTEKLKKVKGQYLYLKNITKNSLGEGLVKDNEYEDWKNLIFLRNCMVHNNAISDCDRTFDIGERCVEARKGKMLEGKIDLFAIVTEVAVERYYSWVRALIKMCG